MKRIAILFIAILFVSALTGLLKSLYLIYVAGSIDPKFGAVGQTIMQINFYLVTGFCLAIGTILANLIFKFKTAIRFSSIFVCIVLVLLVSSPYFLNFNFPDILNFDPVFTMILVVILFGFLTQSLIQFFHASRTY